MDIIVGGWESYLIFIRETTERKSIQLEIKVLKINFFHKWRGQPENSYWNLLYRNIIINTLNYLSIADLTSGEHVRDDFYICNNLINLSVVQVTPIKIIKT